MNSSELAILLLEISLKPLATLLPIKTLDELYGTTPAFLHLRLPVLHIDSQE